ncbi:MAG TPA: DUF4294 domain-containing protein [Sediminibacterium sp.]|uniref:DUF4294 domain-containing protein n=1 Tax=Sediminibacterium sp. TaxID=1917865 RepID=UPI000A7A452A|nr:DUF4294 domain-containing protein [Sediminibacterium sp.]HLD52263.1 DUF4294 domain-containing protein [Sediminibacterium sp.]HQS23512.1 DUF4294 domain-containing protein [Sediminibacterium sp.]HQS34270.1 DUF4294 domain-containing protein [Sediminibacterium sp.]
MKPKHNYIILLIFLSLSFCRLYSQEKGQFDTVKVYAYITPEGDTIGESWLPSVLVIKRLTAAQKNYWADWTRLRNAVYVTYPYAKAAARIINEINIQLVNVKDKKIRRQIIRSREKEMKKQFTDQLTKLSVYQGRVLMKLINRETGNNCYEIIDEYKGFMTAAFWQTVAVLFGSNLKQAYDPSSKDADIEKIVKDVARMYGYPS